MNIPEKLIPYVNAMEDDSIFIKYESDSEIAEMKQTFSMFGKQLRKKCRKIKNLSNIEISAIEEYVLHYSLYLAGAAFGNIKEEQKNDNPLANIGEGAQHWIPRCYMKPFSKVYERLDDPTKTERKTLKVHRRTGSIWDTLAAGTKKYFDTELISLDDIDFREPQDRKGYFYEPQFEILLSLIENDYADVTFAARPQNLWDFIVLSVFFLLMPLRTKEYRETMSTLNTMEQMKDLTGTLIYDFPKRIANLEVRLLSHKIAIPLEKQSNFKKSKVPPSSLQDFEKQFPKPMMLPFNQRSYFAQKEMNGDSSIWAICTPEYIIWLRHKETEYIPNPTSLHEIVTQIIQSNDFRDSYFHPDHDYWDNLLFTEERRERIKDIITEEKLVEALRLCRINMCGGTPTCEEVQSTLDVCIQEYRTKNTLTRGFLPSFKKKKPIQTPATTININHPHLTGSISFEGFKGGVSFEGFTDSFIFT